MDKAPLTRRRPVAATTRRVLKALSLFTGVQSINMAVAVVRTKLVALWIGQAGVGLLSLYTWCSQIIIIATQFNIGQSAVRDVSAAESPDARTRTAAMVRRLGLILGIGGAVVTILLSPLLSLITFGDSTHTVAFIALASIMPLTATASVESALMQGFEHLKDLARYTLCGAIAGTAVALPLYYFFRIDAIVPVLIVFALSNCICALIFRVRTSGTTAGGIRQTLKEGRGILCLGTSLTVSTLASYAAVYAFMVFLNRLYGEGTVGVYNAGSTMLNTYVGIIFTAISMEFYPRLSKVCHSALRTRAVVSHEASMSLWILMPVIVIVICCSRLLIQLLYSEAFIEADSYISIGITGMALRAPAWCMAFCMIARGDARVFLVTECSSALIYFGLSTVLFSNFGFAGQGTAYFLWYVFYFIIVYAVYRFRYGLTLSRGVLALTVSCLVTAALTLVLAHTAGRWVTLAIMLTAIVLAAFIYFRRR